jgi:acetyl-CoA C-acetyltransferase
MSRVPMFSASSLAQKAGMGHYQDSSLRERYPQDFSQFTGAEMIARQFGFTKDQLDEYALQSHRKATKAVEAGTFDDEILPVEMRPAQGVASGGLHTIDEGIRFEATLAGIQGVKLLQEGGVITAANASQICDGASGVMVVSERGLKALGVQPLARVHHMSVLGGDPVVMLDTPLPASQRALQKAGMKIGDIDLYEVNEAFAPVPLAWLQALDADPARLNVHGGAIALGHPLGASGTKLMTTLVHALHRHGGRYGLQTMCEGGGMANVTIVERL